MRYGINIHAPVGEGVSRCFDHVAGAGFGMVRVDFAWPFIEPEPEVYNWARYDSIVECAERAGIGIIATLAYTPSWATDGPYWSGVPRSTDDWVRFCSAVALRYRGRVALWELWNEPNLPWHFGGSCDDYIERILVPASNAIHAISGQRVGGPALAHIRNWYKWLRRIAPYRDPDRHSGRLDVLTHHAYASSVERLGCLLAKPTLFRRVPWLWWLVEPSVMDVLRYCHQPPLGVWLTETGWDSESLGETMQAFEYLQCLTMNVLGGPFRLDDGGLLDRLMFYELMDDPRYEKRWGIIRPDGVRKQSWYVCQNALGGNG